MTPTAPTQIRVNPGPMKYLTYEEAAKELGKCKKTIQNYIACGWLHPGAINRKTKYISREDLDKFLEAAFNGTLPPPKRQRVSQLKMQI